MSKQSSLGTHDEEPSATCPPDVIPRGLERGFAVFDTLLVCQEGCRDGEKDAEREKREPDGDRPIDRRASPSPFSHGSSDLSLAERRHLDRPSVADFPWITKMILDPFSIKPGDDAIPPLFTFDFPGVKTLAYPASAATASLIFIRPLPPLTSVENVEGNPRSYPG
ncbi:hypothetical protein KM043_013622 [Ampulex compressa]|nr:hypothetical protein KM043_013622 [Ampulex compressa]